MPYSYDRTNRIASGGTLTDRFRQFFEETAKALQKEWRASSPKSRVMEKAKAEEYTVEVTLGEDTSLFDRRVSFKLVGGVLHFAIEQFQPRATKMQRLGVGTASPNVDPSELAKLVDRATSNPSLY